MSKVVKKLNQNVLKEDWIIFNDLRSPLWTDYFVGVFKDKPIKAIQYCALYSIGVSIYRYYAIEEISYAPIHVRDLWYTCQYILNLKIEVEQLRNFINELELNIREHYSKSSKETPFMLHNWITDTMLPMYNKKIIETNVDKDELKEYLVEPLLNVIDSKAWNMSILPTLLWPWLHMFASAELECTDNILNSASIYIHCSVCAEHFENNRQYYYTDTYIFARGFRLNMIHMNVAGRYGKLEIKNTHIVPQILQKIQSEYYQLYMECTRKST